MRKSICVLTLVCLVAAGGFAASSRPQPLHHVLAVQRDGYLLLPLTDVCFFRVEDGVTKVKTSTTSYRTNYAIGDLESRLPSL